MYDGPFCRSMLSLYSHIFSLVSLSELNITANDLEYLPPSIGFLRHLRTLYADENFIYEIPPEVYMIVYIVI